MLVDNHLCMWNAIGDCNNPWLPKQPLATQNTIFLEKLMTRGIPSTIVSAGGHVELVDYYDMLTGTNGALAHLNCCEYSVDCALCAMRTKT